MQNELIKQKKLAVIGRMAAGVAHEINNPISFIKSNHLMERRYLDKLEYDSKEGSSNKDILNNLLTINQESEEGLRRITNVVQNLLSFSRTGSSGEKSKYQINEEMTKTISLLGKATRERIHFLFELSQDIPELICYGNEINQVILNLVNNAVQSIPEDYRGEVILRSFTEGSRVIFEIEDNGKPIAERIKDELFEPFFTTKAGGKGTGLGLSLSQDIIEKRHKGVLCLKKGPKKIFRFELPIS
jgi:two-component system NtrC family sensor kinase